VFLPLDQWSGGDVRYDSTYRLSGAAQTRHRCGDHYLGDDGARCPGSRPTTGGRRFMDTYPPLVALFPGSYFLTGCSQAIDSQCHDISLSQICWGPHSQADPCGSASTDDVTGQKRHKLPHIADERRYVKNHFSHGAFLSEFAIHGKPGSQSARIRDFISGCQKRPSGANVSALFPFTH